MQEEKHFLWFRIDVDPEPQINHGQGYKRILQLKFLIRFAEALFKTKGNSSEKLCTLEGIRDITVGEFRNSGCNSSNSW